MWRKLRCNARDQRRRECDCDREARKRTNACASLEDCESDCGRDAGRFDHRRERDDRGAGIDESPADENESLRAPRLARSRRCAPPPRTKSRPDSARSSPPRAVAARDRPQRHNKPAARRAETRRSPPRGTRRAAPGDPTAQAPSRRTQPTRRRPVHTNRSGMPSPTELVRRAGVRRRLRPARARTGRVRFAPSLHRPRMRRRRLKKERARTTRPPAQLRPQRIRRSTKPGAFAARPASMQRRPRRRPAGPRRAAERPRSPNWLRRRAARVRRSLRSEGRGGDPEQ